MNMTLVEFRKVIPTGSIFTLQQARAVAPEVASSTLTRWVAGGHLVRLKRGLYMLSEDARRPGVTYRVANTLYFPSYISTYTALAYYGLIPEGVVSCTSVTLLKTQYITNSLGTFSYQSITERLYGGWRIISAADAPDIYMATPEKALVDLLWLNPQYRTEEDFLHLRLDADMMASGWDRALFMEMAQRSDSQTLIHRADRLLHTYGLSRP